jgi:arylsulfatase A-like enzyme
MFRFLTLHLALAGLLPCTVIGSEKPNILWLTAEDHGPHLGCYRDTYATTPNLDALAAKGLRFRRVWSNAPVCAPARTAIITGMYPTSLGAEHMRSLVPLPEGVKLFPEYLREAGYFCTNNSKEDYNVEKNGKVWDESSAKAHWRNRAKDQPFFAVFNFTQTHESQIRARPHMAVHDPAKAPVPPYHPDTPEVRSDWAQYYDKLTEVDAQVRVRLKEIADEGLVDDTIIFYFSDHGAGMPRGKRWAGDSGLRVPLIVYFPDRWKHLAPRTYDANVESTELISFVDLAPTILSICGMKPKEFHQGAAFAGKFPASPRTEMFGFRGRMDERMDMVRSVTDGKFVYLRNYYPDRSHGQHVAYQFETPTTRVWKQLFDQGKTTPNQSAFWIAPRSLEELYDLSIDPHETQNLAGDPGHFETLTRLRDRLHEWQCETQDLGFMPEAMRVEISAGRSPRDALAGESSLTDIWAGLTSKLKGRRGDLSLPDIWNQRDPLARYWGAVAIRCSGRIDSEMVRARLRELLRDESKSTCVVAAEVLGRFGNTEDLRLALENLSGLANPQTSGVYAAMEAMAAIDELGQKSLPLLTPIEGMPLKDPKATNRVNDNVANLRKSILAKLKPKR